jgi:hypothetical protein
MENGLAIRESKGIQRKWICVSEMNNGMVPFAGVRYDDKWFLRGLDSHQ